MTLTGTQTYLVGDRELIVIDPGPAIESHLSDIVDYVRGLGARVAKIVATHSHPDHLPGAWRLRQMTGAPLGVFAGSRLTADALYNDGDRVTTTDCALDVIHTPGHASDHICFYWAAEKALFTGDVILGQGTTVIAHPDGNLVDYLASLRRLQALDLAKIFPAHGPVVENPQDKIQEYIAHRMMREEQILSSLRQGAKSSGDLVRAIYVDLNPYLYSFAELSVQAHLAKLEQEGRVTHRSGAWILIGMSNVE
jgi:glyoxylase-like metal-dependent hydrolase (beta-lactamase superfamily II)